MINVRNVIFKAERLEALAYAVDNEMLSITTEGCSEENCDRISRAQYLFDILYDELKNLKTALDDLSGHIRVCDAVYAVNQVRQITAEDKADITAQIS